MELDTILYHRTQRGKKEGLHECPRPSRTATSSTGLARRNRIHGFHPPLNEPLQWLGRLILSSQEISGELSCARMRADAANLPIVWRQTECKVDTIQYGYVHNVCVP